MARYVYPAVFTPEDSGFSVNFPDLESCYTCGDNLADAIYMAEDVLAFTLYDYEKNHRAIPQPSDWKSLSHESEEFVNLIVCDTLHYQKRFNNRAVKKTLSIPEWLNEAALEQNVNFSQVLQEALMEKCNV
ncbi:MAG: type II toxin-antitoxin system HicB family antitoxin [Eubacterium sp.]|nr:type II toxin-antitoxin system HicB family antitoxin [Eubacterium sp.]